MRLLTRSSSKTASPLTITGTLRIDRRTKNLVKRLKPGDIAVIHHEDIDALAGRALLDAKPVAVVNAAQSSLGRYPNTGPMILLEAGIPLIEVVGEEFFNSLKEGDLLTINGDCIKSGNLEVKGMRMTIDIAKAKLVEGQENIGRELAAFAQNTLEHLNTECRLFFEPLDIPGLKTNIRGKHVVVVTRGPGYERDLRAIRNYIKEIKPVIIAVDGAADCLLSQGIKPNILIGDMDSVSTNALKSKADVIVHGYIDPNRISPGEERCRLMEIDAKLLRGPGTSEDLAMLVAYEMGAELIVTVGSHFSLEEFLDKGRAGMSSTFLTRLKTGSKLVDAKGASRLYVNKSSIWDYVWLVAAAALMVGIAALLTPLGQTMIDAIRTWMRLQFR